MLTMSSTFFTTYNISTTYLLFMTKPVNYWIYLQTYWLILFLSIALVREKKKHYTYRYQITGEYLPFVLAWKLASHILARLFEV